jgi:hypothetical protein
MSIAMLRRESKGGVERRLATHSAPRALHQVCSNGGVAQVL